MLICAAHVLCFLRWHLLLRTLNVPIRLRDTLRLGFLGHLLNFVSPGHVGGDLFKALLVAREQTDRRAEAVATIVVDRVCGLYALLVVAALALRLTGHAAAHPSVAAIADVTYVLCLVGAVALIVVMIPGVPDGRLSQWASGLPRVGSACGRVFDAVRLYQHNKLQLAVVAVLSLGVHVLIAIGIFFAATGIYRSTPSLRDHFVVSPLAGVAGAVPLTPGGLGSYELAMTYLYDLVSSEAKQGRGLVIALCYRLSSILVAAVGVVFYWLRHREIAELVRRREECDD